MFPKQGAARGVGPQERARAGQDVGEAVESETRCSPRRRCFLTSFFAARLVCPYPTPAHTHTRSLKTPKANARHRPSAGVCARRGVPVRRLRCVFFCCGQRNGGAGGPAPAAAASLFLCTRARVRRALPTRPHPCPSQGHPWPHAARPGGGLGQTALFGLPTRARLDRSGERRRKDRAQPSLTRTQLSLFFLQATRTS